jgi:hypothetical protein
MEIDHTSTVGHLFYHNLTYSDLDVARRITEDHNIHVYKVYAHEVHAYEVHAREIHAHDVHTREIHAVRYTPMRYTPVRCTPRLGHGPITSTSVKARISKRD